VRNVSWIAGANAKSTWGRSAAWVSAWGRS